METEGEGKAKEKGEREKEEKGHEETKTTTKKKTKKTKERENKKEKGRKEDVVTEIYREIRLSISISVENNIRLASVVRELVISIPMSE